VRGDVDVLEWLKSYGSGYPSRLSDIFAERHAQKHNEPIATASATTVR
jgi:uncharacterized protein (DUF4415 family)